MLLAWLVPSALALGGLTFVISWTLFGLGVGPPIDRLPDGDPAVRRLMEGIARRVARLHKRKEEAPHATQMILEDLIEGAERLREAAAKLADKAASMDDPMTHPDAGGASTARDAAVQRLLEIAAALDDALAAATDAGQGEKPRLPEQDGVLGQIVFVADEAGELLRQIVALRRRRG